MPYSAYATCKTESCWKVFLYSWQTQKQSSFDQILEKRTRIMLHRNRFERCLGVCPIKNVWIERGLSKFSFSFFNENDIFYLSSFYRIKEKVSLLIVRHFARNLFNLNPFANRSKNAASLFFWIWKIQNYQEKPYPQRDQHLLSRSQFEVYFSWSLQWVWATLSPLDSSEVNFWRLTFLTHRFFSNI